MNAATQTVEVLALQASGLRHDELVGQMRRMVWAELTKLAFSDDDPNTKLVHYVSDLALDYETLEAMWAESFDAPIFWSVNAWGTTMMSDPIGWGMGPDDETRRISGLRYMEVNGRDRRYVAGIRVDDFKHYVWVKPFVLDEWI